MGIKNYVTLKSIEDMKFQIKMEFNKKLNGYKTSSIFIWSLPGVGKSSAIQDLGEELTEELKKKGDNRRVVTRIIQANHLGESELAGMPSKVKSENNEDVIKRLMVEGMLPMPKDEEYNLPGILFFDELSDAKPEIRPELLSFCDGIERKDGYKMPPFWIVVAAGNTEEGGGLTTFGDFSLNVKARFANFFILPNPKEWLRWATTHKNKITGKVGLDPLVVAFIRNDENSLFDDEEKFQSNMEKYDTAVSPRKWHEVSDTIQIYRDCGYFEEGHAKDAGYERLQLNNYIIAQLGPEVGEGKFINFINNADKMIPSDDLIKKNPNNSENKELVNKINKADRNIKCLSFDIAIRKFINEYGN